MLSIQKTSKVRSSEISKARDMTADEFKAWLLAMNFTGAAAANALGVSPASVSAYQREGAPASIRLACRLLYPRQDELIAPWEGGQ